MLSSHPTSKIAAVEAVIPDHVSVIIYSSLFMYAEALILSDRLKSELERCIFAVACSFASLPLKGISYFCFQGKSHYFQVRDLTPNMI
jgi:hypothetical protein